MSPRRKNPAAVALGRRGGQATTEAKAEAARANGAKGGRPRTAPRVHVDGCRFALRVPVEQCACGGRALRGKGKS